MPLVNVMVNSRAYTIACDEGEEDHLRELAAIVDAKAREVLGSVGQVGDSRLILMAALLIADEHHAPPPRRIPPAVPRAIWPGRSKACTCGRPKPKAPPPMRWKPPPPASKRLPLGLRTPKLETDGYCLVRQVAMPRGLNCTHRELSLVGTVVPDTRRPPAKAGP